MKKRIFERYNKDGKLIDKAEREIKTCWDDITMKQFIAYMKIVERLQEFNRIHEAGESIDSDEESELKNILFFADMLVVLTGLEKDFVYTMDAPMIVQLYNELDFTQETLPKGHCTEFWFRSASEKAIRISEKHYKETSWLKPKHKLRAKAELMLMKKSHFTLQGDINHVPLRRWIATRGILKKINTIKGEMKSGNFENYALLIAYIVEKNASGMTIKECQRLGVVFEDLPFTTSYNMVNFFLNVQSVLSSNMKLYLQQMAATVKTNPKHPKSNV